MGGKSYVLCCAQILSHVRQFAMPRTVGHQAPWNSPGNKTVVGCHFHLQGIFLTQRSNPHFLSLMSPALTGGLFTTGITWEARKVLQFPINNMERKLF